MKQLDTFNAKPTTQENFRYNPVFMTLQVNIMNGRIIVQEYDNIPAAHAQHRYEYDMINDEEFAFNGDYHRTTKNMLIGIGQRLRQLQRYGQDREP